jgi:hypothetical protein
VVDDRHSGKDGDIREKEGKYSEGKNGVYGEGG